MIRRMQFLHYIAGKTRAGKLVAIGFELSPDPEASLQALQGTMPFEVTSMAVEVGDSTKLETLRAQFRDFHANGLWYRPDAAIQEFVGKIESVDPAVGRTKRVSLDLVPEDFHDLETLVQETGIKGKAKLLRRALRFYAAMHRLKAQGFMIQAVKGGRMIQFPDLEAVLKASLDG